MEEISNDVILRCLLSRTKENTRAQHDMLEILCKKIKYGKLIDAVAEEYCIKEGWLEKELCSVPLENGGKRYWNEVEITELGKQQIPILWKESNINPRNIWIRRVKMAFPWLLALLAISQTDTILSAILDFVKYYINRF